MEATAMSREKPLVPPAPDNTRKIITLPKELAERVRRFWHARMLQRESQAYVELLEKGLDAFEREEREEKEHKS